MDGSLRFWHRETHPIKGECLIIVSGSDEVAQDEAADLTDLEAVAALIQAGEKPNAAIKKVAKIRGLVRQELLSKLS